MQWAVRVVGPAIREPALSAARALAARAKANQMLTAAPIVAEIRPSASSGRAGPGDRCSAHMCRAILPICQDSSTVAARPAMSSAVPRERVPVQRR